MFISNCSNYSITIMLTIFHCRVWWPFFVVIFYVLAPIPVLIANRYSDTFQSSSSTTPKDLALFITAGIVISAYGLPIILARAPILAPVVRACQLYLVDFFSNLFFSPFRSILELARSFWWATPWSSWPFYDSFILSVRIIIQEINSWAFTCRCQLACSFPEFIFKNIPRPFRTLGNI